VFHTDLSRDGPGLLLRDLSDPEAAQVQASVAVIAEAGADVLLLLGVDYDAGGAALSLLQDRLSQAGADYPFVATARPNTGWPTGLDLDGDGRAHGPRDSHGYGLFNGQGGMALLSRYPVLGLRSFSDMPWRDLPESRAAEVTPPEALPILRLASVAAWDVALELPDGAFHVLALHATPPVFDGPEDRNGLRNADELRFWAQYLDGWAPEGPPFAATRFAVMGTLNVDPERGEGRRDGLRALLDHPRLQDPRPRGAAGTATADWAEPSPGNLRVDYILPAAGIDVLDSGVMWRADDPVAATASDHRLVWVTLAF
jgi:endonuclease/exonuclease/phosphatase family metal-dependent hydrolase